MRGDLISRLAPASPSSSVRSGGRRAYGSARHALGRTRCTFDAAAMEWRSASNAAHGKWDGREEGKPTVQLIRRAVNFLRPNDSGMLNHKGGLQ
eukprot:scaffold62124_cov21-Prasinocladus_malaysianus.AAC.2